jgi:hypothetical protein
MCLASNGLLSLLERLAEHSGSVEGDGFLLQAQDEQGAHDGQAIDEWRDGFGTGTSDEDELGATELLQFFGLFFGISDNVMLSSKLGSQVALVFAGRQSSDAIAHLVGELDAQVAKLTSVSFH